MSFHGHTRTHTTNSQKSSLFFFFTVCLHLGKGVCREFRLHTAKKPFSSSFEKRGGGESYHHFSLCLLPCSVAGGDESRNLFLVCGFFLLPARECVVRPEKIFICGGGGGSNFPSPPLATTWDVALGVVPAKNENWRRRRFFSSLVRTCALCGTLLYTAQYM